MKAASTKRLCRMEGSKVLTGKFKRVLPLLIAAACVLSAASVGAADEGPQVLGSVVGIGGASMKTALNTWMPVDAKTFPVVNGSAFKTNEGTLYIGMKDGATLELGKKTDALLKGAIKDYRMQLDIGTVAFKVYHGTGLSVKTPSTTVVVQPSWQSEEKSRQSSKHEISGVISYDGVETRVVCFRGKIAVTPTDEDTRYLSENNMMVIGGKKGGEQAAPSAQATGSRRLAVSYESPTTQVLRTVETGGLEVVSEKTP
jgi:hypothetical protein